MPGPVTTLTKRRLYCSRFLARPLGVFFLSCLATWEEEKKRGFEGACVCGVRAWELRGMGPFPSPGCAGGNAARVQGPGRGRRRRRCRPSP